MGPQRYFTLILAAALALVAGTYALAWWLQPLYGDLARIGSHAERDFGWNTPMRQFSPLAASWGVNGYDRPVDVLVLGDSFANLRPALQWQNWLAAKTGWRILTLDKHHVDIAKLVASPLYLASPPRVVIWNTIERDLIDEYTNNDGHCHTYVSPSWHDPLNFNTGKTITTTYLRPMGLDAINPGFARSWMWKRLLRNYPNIYRSDTLLLRLKRSDLFTNRCANTLLLYRKDLRKITWKENDLTRIRCSFTAMAAGFEANGVTRFVTALAPDKSSAYRPWLVNPERLPESLLPELLNKSLVPDARFDISLSSAIAAGTRDVYMPDDTHWGSAGHHLVADAILQLLLKNGLAK